MKKSISRGDVFYTIAWSKFFDYDKYSALRILPELSGIICLVHKRPSGEPEYLICYECWRDGLRMGLRNFMDVIYSRFPEITTEILKHDVMYKYAIVDTSTMDIKDIMFWFMNAYKPKFNNYQEFCDSKRYKNIFVREIELNENDLLPRTSSVGL